MHTALSVVTVVKDDIPGLTRTRDSLAGCAPEDLHRIEWVVVDSSADAEAVSRIVAESSLDGKTHWVAPAGVYEAMNTAIDIAQGEYIYFLNAGDRLHRPQALTALVATISREAPVWFYGQVAFTDHDGAEVIPPRFDYRAAKRAHFSSGRFPPHQGTVVRRDTLRSIGGFDTSYRITADYTAMLHFSLLADPKELDEVVADFDTGGISEQRWLLAINEFHRARLEVMQPRGWDLVREFTRTGDLALRTALHRARTRIRAHTSRAQRLP